MNKASLAAAGLLLLLGLSACGAQQAPVAGPLSSEQIVALSETEAEAGNTEQAEILRDGTVTSEEHDRAFQLVRSCYESFGYSIVGPEVSPIDGYSYSYAIDAAGYEEESVWTNLEGCETRYWQSVVRAYGSTREAVMDPALLRATQDCLAAQDQNLPDAVQNLRDIMEANGVDQEDALSCVSDNAVDLYPDLPALSLEF